ncbi:MAG: THUMP domain-containing protein [Acidobacteriota bacterium]
MRLIATCAVGLEPFLHRELTDLGGVSSLEAGRGAVTFEGQWADVWRANLRLRTANRVLIELASWSGQDGDALHAGARNLVRRRKKSAAGLDIGRLISPERTFAVRATSVQSKVGDVRWVALRVKDGLVDGQRDRHGRRSSVDRQNPDLHLRVRLFKNQTTLLLDTSGEPLDRRGYRFGSVAAPLRETLAAACVLASGWDGEGPVIDPMCGSGTLLAEAGWWALGYPPSRLRRGFPFEQLPGFKAEAYRAVKGERATATASAKSLRLIGLDRDPMAIEQTKTNLEAAGLERALTATVGDAFSYAPPEGPGLVLVNPPYGERLGRSEGAWRHLGDLLKRRYAGYTAVVVAGGEDQGKSIGLRPKRRYSIKNGPLDARILVFELY